jgi:hypothetical protein
VLCCAVLCCAVMCCAACCVVVLCWHHGNGWHPQAIQSVVVVPALPRDPHGAVTVAHAAELFRRAAAASTAGAKGAGTGAMGMAMPSDIRASSARALLGFEPAL